MAIASAPADESAPNHPLATRMGAIAWVSHNMVVGCIMGSFSVLIAAVSQRTGLTTEKALLAGPMVMLGSALAAPLAGDLIARFSLRKVVLGGALMTLLGFLILAFVPTTAAYYASYFLLFGPGMAIAGSIGPATLVTRWFNRNRGLALGIVHVNLIVAMMPLLCNWIYGTYGALAVYMMMAALVGLLLVPSALAMKDFPPDAATGEAAPAAPPEGMTMGQIARQPVFWMLSITSSAIISGIMMLTFSMVQLAEGFGYTRGQGAFLQTVMSLVGMPGSILFGILADRLGGYKGLALLSLNFALLLCVLLFKLPYGVLVVVIGLLGLHGGGMVPNVSRALASSLGQHAFSRAFGLSSFLSVVFTAIALWGMGAAHEATGSYGPALIGLAALLFCTIPLALGAMKVKVR